MVWPFRPSSYYAKITEKRAIREHALSKVSTDELSYEETQIVGSTAQDIVHSIQHWKWTSLQVVNAFIKAALRAQLLTNAITEVMFEEAIRDAEALDIEFARTGQIKGPLHGLPISFKDQYDVKGYDTTIGFTQWIGKLATTDSDLVKSVRDAGGIPLFKTNVPQTLLAFECNNPLWGRTTNPFSALHSSGGSSGGEAAAIAMDGAALGFGSDIGGSLRIPSHYCGIYCLKPGNGRISRGGSRGPTPGSDGITGVAGPMGRSVGDVELACRVVFGQEGRLHMPPPLPYRDVELPEKLRFGYYTSDGFAKASPPCKRAVLETVEALRRQGHDCIEFEIPSPSRGIELFAALTSADGYKTMLSHLGPDPKDAALKLATLVPRIPGWIRAIGGWVMRRLLGDYLLSPMFSAFREKSVAEYYKLANDRIEYNVEFYEKVWDHYTFDGIIAPVQALPAVAHGGCENLSPLANATILYNVVDSPAGCIPVTRVDPAIDQLTEEWTKRGEGKGQGSPVLEKRLYGKGGAYDADKMRGLPIGIQIVGRRWQEEKVIEMMKVVDGALGPSRGFGPSSWEAIYSLSCKLRSN